MPEHQLSPAERYAALSALAAGLNAQIAAAKADVAREAESMRKASWPTPWGPVNAGRRDPGVEVDPDAFLAYVEQHHPDAIVTTRTVSPATVQALLSDLAIVGRNVMSKSTGEVVEWAHVGPAGGVVVSYPASSQQREAKALAVMLFEDRASALVSGLREVTA